ncbi:MAG: glycosyl transferase [Oscillospiraceae bacterium]|nr:glycosyl transferase [Oscillospiraceae bacterium]
MMMKYNAAFDENGSPSFTYYRERIVKNHMGFLWEGAVHEVIVPRGDIIYSDIAIAHKSAKQGYSDRNLKIFQKILKERKILSPREKFYYARELYYHEDFGKAIETFESFLSGGKGWIENNIEACRLTAFCHYRMGNRKNALYSLFKSFEYDAPRAEICCDIGSHFMDDGKYQNAIFWFQTALSCRQNPQSGGFVSIDCYGFIPCIQLCVCYDRLGNYKLAEEYNELAGSFKPEAEAYLSNKIYFRER